MSEGNPRLREVLEFWIDANKLSRESLKVVDEETQTLEFSVGFQVEGQDHSLFIVVNERAEQVFVFSYSPYRVVPKRAPCVARIINRINRRKPLARFAFVDEGESSPVQAASFLDARGGSLLPVQIDRLIEAVESLFVEFGDVVAAAALTNLDADRIWQDFLSRDEDRGEEVDPDDEEDGPAEL